MEGEELSEEQKQQLAAIRKKKALLIQEHRLKKTVAQSRSTVPRKFDKYTTKRMGRELSALGLDPSSAMNRARSKSRGRKRDRSEEPGNDAMELDDEQQTNKKQRVRSKSRSMSISRSMSRPPAHEVVSGDGFKDSPQKKAAIKISNKSHKKER